MASTSNSKRPSSSSNPKWRYDVFLSFRGEDTRKSFTAHLYSALDRGNIETFRDDEELPRGEEIAPELLKAIEGSRIAIIVFSKTYAHSKWCLEELVKIMECQEEKGQKVFPIFYHVEPSEVRNQTGTYGEAFNNHERNADEEKKKKIEEWRTALRKAGNLGGFPLQDRSEPKFIEEIIGEIRRLIPKVVHVGENIVGLDEKLKEVKLLIDTQSNKVSVVGIYGIGGIGKTTIAKGFYNDMLDQFNNHSFLENVREKSKDDAGLLQLQEKLLCDILMVKNLKLNSINDGTNMIERKLCRKKVLIVLDDVECPKQVNFLAGSSEWFGRGSIIIITTRNKRCLDVHEVYSLYEAKGLAHDQAMELFCWNAFQQCHPKDNYVDLSNHILCHAKGLPLSLVVLGSFLFKRDVDEWESTLHKLKTTPPEEIQKVLQISYNGLDETCQKLFLDIACFFKDHDENFVTRTLEGCNFHPKIGLRLLSERCLISILHGTIKMHDLLQEMGWAIVRQNNTEHPGKWSRLWEYKDINSVFTKNTATENIEGIFLEVIGAKPIRLTAETFRKMNGLRLLKVRFIRVQLSQDFELPCHNLTYFHWNGYPLESMPSNFHADNLVELSLKFSNIKHLWKGNMQTTKLKVINLSHSRHLVDISSILSVPNLEILILEGCIRLESLPGNLYEFKCLQILSCAGCSKIESFPDIKQGNMGRLRELNLSRTGIIELPSSIRHLHGLEKLDLSCCKNLASLPEGICSLSSLQTLLLSECSNLKGFPDINIGCLRTLEGLYLSGCRNLESLPRNLHVLKCLQTLSCDGCSKIKSFPEIKQGNMGRLRELNLSKTGIVELPSSIRHLHGLEELNLSYCENLASVPDSICSLSSLQTILLAGCSELQGFLDINIGSLKALELLDLSGCRKVKAPLEVNLGFDSCSLRSLILTCRILNSGVIWSNDRFSSLKALSSQSYGREEEFLNYIFPLSSLVELSVRNSSLMERDICSGSFHLSSLQILSGRNFHLMKGGILGDIFHLSSLRNLSFGKCNLIEVEIHHDIRNLSSLISLSLSNCNIMEGRILKHISRLSSLLELSLDGNHFRSLPAGMNQLSNLRALNLSHCQNLLQIRGISGLYKLRALNLSHCQNLLQIHCISGLSNLRALNLSHCKNLLQIPRLPSCLQFLDVHSSDGILSSPSFKPIHSLMKFCQSELIPDGRPFSFRSDGIRIVIPRSSGVLEWLRYLSMGSDKVAIELPLNCYSGVLEWLRYLSMGSDKVAIELPLNCYSGVLEWLRYLSMGSDKVTIELPLNWYENDDLLGFAVWCVYPSPDKSCMESGSLSMRQPDNGSALKFSCELNTSKYYQSEYVDVFSCGSDCVTDGVSDIVRVMSCPKVAFPKRHRTNQWTHIITSFCGSTRVEERGILLIYAKYYEQKHPTMAQGSTSHGNFGEHGSATEDTNRKAHN